LKPIYDLLSGLRQDRRRKTDADYNAASEKLGDLIHSALSDESNEDWLAVTGQVERLVTELNIAFHWHEDPKGHTVSLRPARSRSGTSPPKRRAVTAKR
jgi:hypothetical protein